MIRHFGLRHGLVFVSPSKKILEKQETTKFPFIMCNLSHFTNVKVTLVSDIHDLGFALKSPRPAKNLMWHLGPQFGVVCFLPHQREATAKGVHKVSI